MIAHIYRTNTRESLDIQTTRVTVVAPERGYRFNFPDEPVLVCGTLPNTTAIRMADVRWFWVEED